MAGPAVTAPGAVRGFNCPSCGAAIALRGMAWTQNVACASCGAVVDPDDPTLRVLTQFDQRMRVRPLIPLGSCGEWKGALHQVIGVQQRTIRVDGVAYSWREYLLFNPYRGFRYLTEYDGHWNDVTGIPGLPRQASGLRASTATWDGHTYKHFQTASAETTFVAGEFPWEVRAGDTVQAMDFVDPPYILSAEATKEEVTWSRGEYVDARVIWKAFKLPGAPPSPRGVYANQPSPFGTGARSLWGMFALFFALLTAAFLGRIVTARDAVAFARGYVFDPSHAEQAFVTPSFELTGGSANVVLETEANVDNQWVYVDYALINERTGDAWDVGREVSYYSGYDEDGRWTEGSRRDRARIGPVPGGTYYLRVEPQGDAGATIAYTVRVRRDVPSVGWYVIGLLLLALPPVFAMVRAGSFEVQRWAESDHPLVTSSDDDE